MKALRTYKDSSIIIEAFQRGGYYILRIQQYKVFLAASRRGTAVDECWMPAYEKKFEQMRPANNYFKAIRKNHPELKLLSTEPNTYICSETGKKKTF